MSKFKEAKLFGAPGAEGSQATKVVEVTDRLANPHRIAKITG